MISQLTRKSSNLRFFARHEKSQFLLLCANLDISVLWHTLTFTSTFLKAFSSVIRYALLVCSPGWLMRRPNGVSQSPQLSTEDWNKLGHNRSTPNDVQESLAMIECSNWRGSWYGKLRCFISEKNSWFSLQRVFCLLNQRILQAPIRKQKKMNDWTRDLSVLPEKTIPKRRITDEDGDRSLWLLTLSL